MAKQVMITNKKIKKLNRKIEILKAQNSELKKIIMFSEDPSYDYVHVGVRGSLARAVGDDILDVVVSEFVNGIAPLVKQAVTADIRKMQYDPNTDVYNLSLGVAFKRGK